MQSLQELIKQHNLVKVGIVREEIRKYDDYFSVMAETDEALEFIEYLCELREEERKIDPYTHDEGGNVRDEDLPMLLAEGWIPQIRETNVLLRKAASLMGMQHLFPMNADVHQLVAMWEVMQAKVEDPEVDELLDRAWEVLTWERHARYLGVAAN